MFAFKSTPPASASPKPPVSIFPEGESLPHRKGTNHKTYTGPDPASLPKKRTKAEAEAYFESLGKAGQGKAGQGNLWTPKVDRRLRYGSAITCVAAVIFMTLFVDYGEQDHVFTPIRRQFDKMKRSFSTLSPEERRTVGSKQQPVGAVPPVSGRVGKEESEWKPS